MKGAVHLVGAGPGDPDLITCRGRDLLAAADVVVHDRLIDRRLLTYCRPEAELVDAGKAPGGIGPTQTTINALLVERALGGAQVVRLKGGDPFVFGRGGEEALACVAAGVPCHIVPGVSAAIAGPGLAAIPVTHRGTSRSFAVVAGHAPGVDWRGLRGADTIVILMGVARLAGLAKEMIQAGFEASTPAAVVASASLPGQRRVVADLAGIAEAFAARGVTAPAVLVVGGVVDIAQAIVGGEEPEAGSG